MMDFGIIFLLLLFLLLSVPDEGKFSLADE